MDFRWEHQRIALEEHKAEFTDTENFQLFPMALVVQLLQQHHRLLCQMVQVGLDRL